MSVVTPAETTVRPIRIHNVQDPAIEVTLHRGDLQRLDGDNRWRMILCQRGRIWITQERDLNDYVLDAGEMLIVTQPGRVLVQALRDASVRITPSLKRVPYAGHYPVFA